MKKDTMHVFKKNFVAFKFYLAVSVIALLCVPSSAITKWVSLGFDDPWNEGLFKSTGGVYTVSGVCFDKDKNPHILVNDILYTYWDGEKWRGLESDEPTEIGYPEGFCHVEMRVDSKKRPHLLFTRVVDTVRSLNYIYWEGEKWSDINIVVSTDSTVDSYKLVESSFNFFLDEDDNPHVTYMVRPIPSTGYWHLYYRFFKNGKWQSYGNGDEGLGIFNKIEESMPGFPKIKLDSRNYPHVLCSMTIVDSMTDPVRGKYYTFWDGEKWTGIGNSHKLSGGLPSSTITTMSARGHHFYIDSNDNVHFTYPAEIEGPSQEKEQVVVYTKWDGERWSGLRAGETVTVIDLDIFPVYAYKVDFNEENTLNILTHFQYPPHLRYYYWDGDSWEGLGGTNVGLGVIPSKIIQPGAEYLKSLEYPFSLIACKYHGVYQGEEFSFISVLRWEEESIPTVELYVDDFEHALSGEEEEIVINGRMHNPFESETDVNIIVAMLTPEEDILYFPRWSEGYREIPVTLPAGFALPWTELLTFPLPSESPPIDRTGTYYFGIFLQNPVDREFYTYDIKPFYIVE